MGDLHCALQDLQLPAATLDSVAQWVGSHDLVGSSSAARCRSCPHSRKAAKAGKQARLSLRQKEMLRK